MSRKLQTKWIADNAVTLAKIAPSARTGILAGKLIAARKGVLAFEASAASSDDVSTEVLAAATTDTPVSDLTTALGIYTGAIANGAADPKVVLIRIAGTNEGVDDGSNNEVYGILTEAAGVYTLSYKKSDGTAYTFPAPTDIDYYFVEVQDLSILGPESLLHGSVTGVVDASHATTLAGHLNGGASKHDASEIDVEGNGTYYDAEDLESVIADLDAGIVAAVAAAAAAQADIDGHTDGGNNKHDASEIDVEGTGDYYAPGSVETAIDTLDAQIKANTDAIAAITSEEERGQAFTLSAQNITDKYVDLTAAPKTASLVRLVVVGGLEQDYGVDFTIISDGSEMKRLTWDDAAVGGPSTGMVADLAASDKIRVYYQVEA
jgi:hypothetical protein